MKQITQMPPRYPINGTFELTVRCNLHCKMCLFRHDDRENPEIMKRELTAEQWIDMARQAAEAGTGGILITGGEPLIRSDFAQIYEGIYKHGFLITLYTNATLITPDIMELFRKYPPHKIGVTVYGASGETYEKVCGNAQAFKNTLEGIRKLQTLPSLLEFRTTIIKDNLEDAKAIDELIHREFGAQYPVTQTGTVIQSVRGACADVNSCRLSPKDNLNLMLSRSIDALKQIVGEDNFSEENVRLRYNKRLPEKECEPENGHPTLLGCKGGMDSYTVTWDGKLQACQLFGAFYTDALALGLKKAWEQFPYAVKLLPIDEKCQKCKISELCQCCPASRYAETGKIGGLPEYPCEGAQLMNTMFIKEEI